MRRANGFGSVFKLGGKRRKPYAVRITVGWTDDGKQIFKYLSYHEKITEAKKALDEYNVNPFDLLTKDTTLQDVYKDWLEETDLAEKTLKNYISAINKAQSIHKVKMRDLKVAHFEKIMKNLSPHMKKVFKNAMNQLYIYSLKHEIVERNLMDLITVKEVAIEERIPFTLEEIRRVREYNNPMKDTILILLYTGMRISELLEIENKNIFLDDKYMIGGTKTDAGKNRIIPLHDEILDLVKARYNPKTKYLISPKMSYKNYRHHFWDKMMNDLSIERTPHDTRHTFATAADRYKLNQVAIKRILGHALKDVTDHYTHKSIEELLEEINKVKY